ncbi:MFS transporter [Streptomyces sp. NPDC004111]|uniref:MFS transporter n=1 Tax=Streptomyces sp. NPDC004111 TaxID=3364690 RepID=UPI0036AC94E9
MPQPRSPHPRPHRRQWWRYVVGATAARTGDEMSGPALLLLALAVTGSVGDASSLLAAVSVAAAVGGPVFGVLLDRAHRPGLLLAWALALYAGALLVILAALGRAPAAATLCVAVGAGLLGPALSGGWTSRLPDVVPDEELPRANAWDAQTFGLASLVGPALAGTVAGAAGAPAAVAGSAALIAAAVPATRSLPAVRVARPPRPPAAPRTPERSPRARAAHAVLPVLTDLANGFRAVVRSRPLARATSLSVLSCAGEGVFVAVTPLLGAVALGSTERGALLLSGTALGALGANAVLARLPRATRAPESVLGLSTLVLAAACLLAATLRPGPVVVAAVLAGAGAGPQLTALFAVRHRCAPPGLRGRIFTTGASLKLTGFALGAALAGALAARSLPVALLAAAGLQLTAALAGRLPRKLRGDARVVPGKAGRHPGGTRGDAEEEAAARGDG